MNDRLYLRLALLTLLPLLGWLLGAWFYPTPTGSLARTIRHIADDVAWRAAFEAASKAGAR